MQNSSDDRRFTSTSVTTTSDTDSPPQTASDNDPTRFHVYTDGGLWKKNPSPVGGTWAWIALDLQSDDRFSGSGVIRSTPEIPTTNNATELAAVLLALAFAKSVGWKSRDFVLHTDSEVTINRVRSQRSKTPFADFTMGERLVELSTHFGPELRMVLLQGHPSRKELKAGIGKSGRPVSEWNVWCDRKCTELAQQVFGASESTSVVAAVAVA